MIKNNVVRMVGLFFIASTICLASDKNLIDALELATKLPVQSRNSISPLAKTPVPVQQPNVIAYQGIFSTLSEWVYEFQSLPKNRNGARADMHSGFAQCGTKAAQWKEFKGVLDAWLQMQASGALSVDMNWSQANNGQVKPDADFFDVTKPCKFAPFAQKMITKSGDIFYFHGDLHGDIFSLLDELTSLKAKGVIDNYFKIKSDKVWFVFLGDYVDRGQYGCEVIYTMMRLALANPDRVICVRGNHEDIQINTVYGFAKEVADKFGDANGQKHREINRMNDFLPVVFYLGCTDNTDLFGTIINYIQCCHGGIEEEYQPQLFLDNQNTTYQLLGDFSASHSKDSSFDDGKIPVGFMWTDFDVQDSITQGQPGGKILKPDRGYMYGQQGTDDVLHQQSSVMSKIRGIMRAHQHTNNARDPMMKGLIESNGVYKLWKPYEKIPLRKLDDGLVWTFNVAPDSVYGAGVGFDFDTYARVVPAQKYDQWTMEVFNTKVL